MSCKYISVFWIVLTIFCEIHAQGYEISNLPLSPPVIISQTDASKELCLFGEPENDIDPIDGIGDTRYSRLLHISQIFSPILVKNTLSAPVKVGQDTSIDVTQGIDSVFIDSFDNTVSPPHLVGSDTLIRWNEDYANEIIKLFDSSYFQASNSSVQPNSDILKIMFFNLPGDDVDSWKEKNEMLSVKSPFVYMHPFIHRVSKTTFEFVLQYWFFYPFNDGGNNHEGDWEHMNVWITLKDKARGALTHQDIWAILHTNGYEASDRQLVIKRVEYYFHHFVMVLDYASTGIYEYRDRSELASQLPNLIKKQTDPINKEIVRRAITKKGRIIRQPIAYIGGDDKSIINLVGFFVPGSRNRDSHGTYPLPGIYKKIGPIDATERISKDINEASQKDIVRFTESQIQILPDWERIYDRIKKNNELAAKWSWFILPVRWGKPTSKSPGAGIVKYADTGNLSPVGPAYNTAWNRVGNCRGYELYEAESYSARLLGFKDFIPNNARWFQVPINNLRTLAMLPPFDIFHRPLPFVRFQSLFMPKSHKQERVFTINLSIPFRRMAKYTPVLTTEQLQQVTTILNRNELVFDRSPIYTPGPNFSTIGVEIGYNFDRYWQTNHFVTIVYRDELTITGNPPSAATNILARARFSSVSYLGSIRLNLANLRVDNEYAGLTPYLRLGWGYSKAWIDNIYLRKIDPTNIFGFEDVLLINKKERFFKGFSMWPPWRILNFDSFLFSAGLDYLQSFIVKGIGIEINYQVRESRLPSGSILDMSGFYLAFRLRVL